MKYKYLLIITILLLVTGCSLFKRDSMENISITTSNYPLEFTTRYLYGENALVTSIYPDCVNIDEYKFTKKQDKDNSEKDLFIYIGNSNDSEQAVTYVKNNDDIKLINATLGMKYNYGIEELWLNPSNMLMIAQNIKNDLQAYITNTYLIKEIEDNYNKLKIELSELDAEIKLTIENASNKVIFVNDNSLRFLEKYGLTIYVLDKDLDIYEKNLNVFRNSIEAGKVKNIFILENTEILPAVEQLINDKKVNKEIYKNLKNITEEERNNEKNYLTLARENLETLKKELY
jgi:zinc transport system substrate-binding protein